MTKEQIIIELKRFNINIESVDIDKCEGDRFICTHVSCQNFVACTIEDVIVFAKRVASFNMQCIAV